MWLQGIKMPVYMWLGVFAISYTAILSLTLDENNVQLISMRILSSLRDWISFDPMKQVNLLLPDNSVRHTYMGYVPYVPDVVLAWSKAVNLSALPAILASNEQSRGMPEKNLSLDM